MVLQQIFLDFFIVVLSMLRYCLELASVIAPVLLSLYKLFLVLIYLITARVIQDLFNLLSNRYFNVIGKQFKQIEFNFQTNKLRFTFKNSEMKRAFQFTLESTSENKILFCWDMFLNSTLWSVLIFVGKGILIKTGGWSETGK